MTKTVSQTDKKKVFLSHAYEDRKIADRIIDKILVPIFELDKRADIFYTSKRETGIRSSLNWRNKIKSSLIDCEIFIALITTNSKQSEMCLGEIGAAWVQNKKMYSIFLPPITYKNFSTILSENQADDLLKREEVESFIESLSIDLKQIFKINQREEVDIRKIINNFLRSIKQFLRKNPGLFDKIQDKKKLDQPKTEFKKEVKSRETKKRKPSAEITSEEQQQIIKQSKSEWPEDYTMQNYYTNEQTIDLINLRKLQNRYKNDSIRILIIERAIKDWPLDFTMQLHEAKEQLDSYDKQN